jgi:hypothetical protein
MAAHAIAPHYEFAPRRERSRLLTIGQKRRNRGHAALSRGFVKRLKPAPKQRRVPFFVAYVDFKLHMRGVWMKIHASAYRLIQKNGLSSQKKPTRATWFFERSNLLHRGHRKQVVKALPLGAVPALMLISHLARDAGVFNSQFETVAALRRERQTTPPRRGHDLSSPITRWILHRRPP